MSKTWIAYAQTVPFSDHVSDPGELPLGSVKADNYLQAHDKAMETFLIRDDESLVLRPHVEGEPIVVCATRLRAFRKDHLKHQIPIGAVVELEVEDLMEILNVDGKEVCIELKGSARLFVVDHTQDCDGSPLYYLAAKPIQPPKGLADRIKYDGWVRYSSHGHGEESLTDTGIRVAVRTFDTFIRDMRNSAARLML